MNIPQTLFGGLQLQILNDELFNNEKKIKEKREKVRQAKKAIPREIELVCLKEPLRRQLLFVWVYV